MGSGVTWSLLDYTSEIGTVSLEGREVDDTSFDAVATEISNIKNAVLAISRGALRKEVRRMETTTYVGTPPSSVEAQREEKWMVRYQDAVNFKWFSFEIPCSNLTFLDPANKGRMLESTEYNTLKAALETWMKSPYGNAVIIEHVYHVGRNI